MGSNKHKHKSRKRKHHSSDSSDKEYDYDKRRHHKRHHKDKKEKLDKPILIDDYNSANSEDDVIILSPPPPPKISHRSSPLRKSPSPPRKKVPKALTPPMPPRISHHRSPSPPSCDAPQNKSSSVTSLSIEETNKIRLKLGLKPLDEGPNKAFKNDDKPKETFGGHDMGDFVHRPPENIRSKNNAEKFKEKLAMYREKRKFEEKLRNVKKLNDYSDDDDVTKWVEKNRKVVSEKEQAEKRAKELDAMDEVFGIGELIEEDFRATKKKAYTSKDLRGLKVEHDMESFKEGKDVILTLKDENVLDEKDDTLVNVNIIDDERYKTNIDRRRQRVGYNAYEDEFAELEQELDKKVLMKYDEEIEGQKKKNFHLGTDAKLVEEARKESIKNKLKQYATGKKLENLSFALQPATDYYTEQEISVKFKKPKKKVRKIRKVKQLKADDLLADVRSLPPLTAKKNLKTEPDGDSTVTQSVHSVPAKRFKSEIKDEPLDENSIDTDDLSPPPIINSSSIMIDIDEEDDMDLQLALHKTRILRQSKSLPNNEEVKNESIEMEEPYLKGETGSIVLNATAEFCRTLGDIPTYGQAGNREEDVEKLMDFDKETKHDKLRRENRKENYEELTSGWNEVAMDTTPVDITTNEVPILDAEPDICTGVAGALKMAISKGYIQTEEEKRPSASRFSHLQAQNYSIEDKAHSLEDDKHARRERYCGPTSDFKEKDGYKPNVKLEYIDDEGHLLSAKEAFRYLSHKFHGKGPGKNKIEKRMKKNEQETLMKQMSSTDTPLGTLNMLQQKQKETQSPFVVLSGSKHGQSTNIAKVKF